MKSQRRRKKKNESPKKGDFFCRFRFGIPDLVREKTYESHTNNILITYESHKLDSAQGGGIKGEKS